MESVMRECLPMNALDPLESVFRTQKMENACFLAIFHIAKKWKVTAHMKQQKKLMKPINLHQIFHFRRNDETAPDS